MLAQPAAAHTPSLAIPPQMSLENATLKALRVVHLPPRQHTDERSEPAAELITTGLWPEITQGLPVSEKFTEING